jgi:hypothetical protein
MTELEDIVKIVYGKDLADKDLVPYLKRYRSIQNKILVDYKQFKASILNAAPATQNPSLPNPSQIKHHQRLNSTSSMMISRNHFMNDPKTVAKPAVKGPPPLQ